MPIEQSLDSIQKISDPILRAATLIKFAKQASDEEEKQKALVLAQKIVSKMVEGKRKDTLLQSIQDLLEPKKTPPLKPKVRIEPRSVNKIKVALPAQKETVKEKDEKVEEEITQAVRSAKKEEMEELEEKEKLDRKEEQKQTKQKVIISIKRPIEKSAESPREQLSLQPKPVAKQPEPKLEKMRVRVAKAPLPPKPPEEIYKHVKELLEEGDVDSANQEARTLSNPVFKSFAFFEISKAYSKNSEISFAMECAKQIPDWDKKSEALVLIVKKCISIEEFDLAEQNAKLIPVELQQSVALVEIIRALLKNGDEKRAKRIAGEMTTGQQTAFEIIRQKALR